MKHTLTELAAIGGTLALITAAGCSSDPRYIAPQDALEVNATDGAGSAATTIVLPIRLEKQEELDERQQIADDLGLTLADIPYVKADDMDVSIEWTLRNLEETDGVAFVDVNGANEWYRYVPDAFVIDPTDPNEPPPPSLVEGIPLEIAGATTMSGVVREGQIREGSIDLELITRGAYNPVAAVLQVNEDITEFALGGTGPEIPEHLFAGMVQFDVNFAANRHMVLEFAVRVRDQRGILHDDLDQAPADELTQFAPADFAPPPPDPAAAL